MLEATGNSSPLNSLGLLLHSLLQISQNFDLGSPQIVQELSKASDSKPRMIDFKYSFITKEFCNETSCSNS